MQIRKKKKEKNDHGFRKECKLLVVISLEIYPIFAFFQFETYLNKSDSF